MQQQRRKRKKKNQQQTEFIEEQISDSGLDLINAMKEMESKKEYVDIQVCPKCKSPKIKRTASTGGDMFGHMGLTPPKYECKECGWSTQLVIKATNKPLTVKEVELIAEANEDKANDYR